MILTPAQIEVLKNLRCEMGEVIAATADAAETELQRGIHWWAGTANAGDKEHNAIYDRMYDSGKAALASWRFRVADDYSAVRIVPCGHEDSDSCDEFAANGIWTLAELLADGSGMDVIDSVAEKMMAAIQKRERDIACKEHSRAKGGA